MHAPSVRNSHAVRWPKEDLESDHRISGRDPPRPIKPEQLVASPRKPIEIQMTSDEDFGFRRNPMNDLDIPPDIKDIDADDDNDTEFGFRTRVGRDGERVGDNDLGLRTTRSPAEESGNDSMGFLPTMQDTSNKETVV